MEPVLIFSFGELIVIVGIIFVLVKQRESSDNSRIISFGAVILTGIGLLFALAMAMFYFEQPDAAINSPGKEIFDKCATILPPIITLILGYYFGKKES
ncbi:hypothetical protein [Cellvibrio sp. OA-2007]|uniref:hypothetical protein n=1 Tax=Cellvibrio sp. OA-2007 TaxID=529823 RepID=UPI00078430A3|nr:hypothetical protein [Cellvibrio sp. OA-2007]